MVSYDFDKFFIIDEWRIFIIWIDGRFLVDNYDFNFGVGCGGLFGIFFIKDDLFILVDKV